MSSFDEYGVYVGDDERLGDERPDELADQERELIRKMKHNLFCTPMEAVTEGKDKGRMIWHRELQPAVGDLSGDWPCRCAEVKIRCKGEVV